MVALLNRFLLLVALVILFSCKSSNDCADRSKYIHGSVKFGKLIKGKYCVAKVLLDQKNGKAKIMGYVIDRISGDFLSAEVIFDEEIKLGKIANEKGFFECEVEPGKYKIQVQHVGFTTLFTKEIEIRPNTMTEMYFYLGTSIIR